MECRGGRGGGEEVLDVSSSSAEKVFTVIFRFLSPALPTKNGVSSKPADFECGVASTSKHHAMFDDDFMSSIEDITDMRSAIADSPQFSLNRQPLQPLVSVYSVLVQVVVMLKTDS